MKVEARSSRAVPAAPRLSVVAPCYDEEAGLPEFHRRVARACVEAVGSDGYEIVLINDGSRDGTWEAMRRLAAADPQHVVAINMARNYGHQVALTAGLRLCRASKYVLIIDADLQDPPELLPEMLRRRREERAEVVYGQRRQRQGETRFKTWTAAAFYRLLRRLVDIDIPRDTGDFRLMTRRSLDVLNSMPEQFRFIRGMVSWMGFRQVPLLYERHARFAGETGYPLAKMIRFALDAITGFSTVPLRVASYLGLVMGLLSAVLVVYTIGSWLAGSAIAGWTSLTTIVLLIGSSQLLVLGVIGEYLGRLYMEAKRRPLYVIDSVVGGPAAEPRASAWTVAAQAPASTVARPEAARADARTPA
jgi:polyisoprenyl-phosphate glycosyltransferase